MQLLFATIILTHLLPTVTSQATKIVDGLHLIQSHIKYTNQLVTYFNGNPQTGTLDAVNIQEEALDLGHAIQYTTSVAHASPNLDEAGSLAVVTAVISLRPDVETLLKNIVAKRPAFDAVVVGLFSVSGQVQQTLTNQKALTQALGYAIAEKLTGAYKTAAPLLLQEFADQFDQAIAAYVDTKA